MRRTFAKPTLAEMTLLMSTLGIEPTTLQPRHLRLLAILLPRNRWVSIETFQAQTGWSDLSVGMMVKEVRRVLPAPWHIVIGRGHGYALVRIEAGQ